jgi:hypothetical protein
LFPDFWTICFEECVKIWLIQAVGTVRNNRTTTTERGMHVFEKVKILEKKHSRIRDELEVFGGSAKSWKFSEHPRKAQSFRKIHDRRKV